MKCLRPIIFRALMLFGISCSSFALGPNDDASCCLHPDPHASSFHAIAYDYQHGCDNVLVDNPNIKIHARFVKYQQMTGTGFSYIEGIGIKTFPSGDTIEIRPGEYYVNDPGLTNAYSVSAPSTYATIGTLPFAIHTLTGYGGFTGYEYEIKFPPVMGLPIHNIVIEDWTSLGQASNDKNYGVSVCINAHGSYFQDSVGMCGEWNAAGGLNDRNGIDMISGFPPSMSSVLNAGTFGDEWQVQLADGPFMSAGQTFPPSGHSYAPASCTARRLLVEDNDEDQQQQRKLPEDNDCDYCDSLDHQVKRDNCHYDASVLGCNVAKMVGQVYYGEDSKYYTNVSEHPPTPIIKPEKCRGLYEGKKWKKTKCTRNGGKCVRFCDTKDENIKCVLGWCKQKKPYEFPKGKDVLLYGRYYNGCSCMLKKKTDEDHHDGPNEDKE